MRVESERITGGGEIARSKSKRSVKAPQMTNNKPPRLKSLYSSREESAHRTFTQIKAVALSVLGTLRMNPALSISDSIYLCSDKRLRLTGGIRLSVPRWLRRATLSNKLLIGCGLRFDQNTHVKERTQ